MCFMQRVVPSIDLCICVENVLNFSSLASSIEVNNYFVIGHAQYILVNVPLLVPYGIYCTRGVARGQ